MVRGDLTIFPLLSVMQMLLASGKAGKLSVTHPRGGDFWVDAGDIVHAQYGPMKGEPALQVLASLDGGIFTFEPNVAAPDRTLSLRREVALTHMLFDQDGWAEVLKVFPEWTSTLRFSARWSEAQPVTQQQYRALRMVTPGVSIRGMLERLAFRPAGDPSTLQPRELLDTLRPFVQAGLVEVVPA